MRDAGRREKYNPRIFAVHCDESGDFFLANGEHAFSAELKSSRTGNIVSLEGRYVQWMNPAGVIRFSPQDVRELVGAIKRAEKNTRHKGRRPRALHDRAFVLNRIQKDIDGLKKRWDDGQPFARDMSFAVDYTAMARKQEFDSVYYEVHSVSFDRVGNEMFVFSVGRDSGRLLLALPILADISAEDLKKLALYAALVIELIKLIGRLFGIKVSEGNCAEKIDEVLRNTKVLQAIANFIEQLQADVTEGLSALWDLFNVMYEEGSLTELLTAAFAGAFSGLGLLWLILTLLSWLLPGVGPVAKILEITACLVALVVKIKAAFDPAK